MKKMRRIKIPFLILPWSGHWAESYNHFKIGKYHFDLDRIWFWPEWRHDLLKKSGYKLKPIWWGWWTPFVRVYVRWFEEDNEHTENIN